nr:MAG TPA: hypothetical protein [Caudoviricetes sp.]
MVLRAVVEGRIRRLPRRPRGHGRRPPQPGGGRRPARAGRPRHGRLVPRQAHLRR